MEGHIISERYRLKKYLGGGMSSVYLADDIILNREVVVKLIKSDPYNKEKMMERFQREVQNTTRLNHPNIVTVLDVDDTSEYHVLVTEYINGPNLKVYIDQNKPLPFDKIVELSLMTLRGIEHAHNRGIIHRDIKPQNILIDENGQLEITDFGIAKALSETRLTETNQVMGSVQYISPEQAKGKIADERADIYSFGIMLYEMITGELPFQAETQVSVALQHIQSPIPNIDDFREDVPVGLKNIVYKCTEKDPNDRYSDAGEVIRDLLNYRNMTTAYKSNTKKEKTAEHTVPIVPPPVKKDSVKKEPQPTPPPVEEKEEKKKRRKWPWLVLLLLLLIGGTAAAALFIKSTPKEVEVVDVQGMSLNEAKETLEESGLVIGEVTREYNESIETDHVINSNPKSGKILQEGDLIDLNVSDGEEPYEMEDFTNKSVDSVKEKLDNLEFKSVNIEEEYSNDVDKDDVIDQSIKPGTKIIPKEESITLTVSLGQEPIEIENFIGNSFENAKATLESQGFVINIVNEIYSDDYDKGIVVGQDPSYGAFLPGSPINLTVSKGKAPKEAKEFQYNVTIPYGDDDSDDSDSKDSDSKDSDSKDSDSKDKKDKKKKSKSKKVTVYIDDKTRNIDSVEDSFEIDEDTPYTINLVLDEGKTGRYKIEVDGNKVLEESIKNE